MVPVMILILKNVVVILMMIIFVELMKAAVAEPAMILILRNAVAILFWVVNMYAALMRLVVKANAVLLARPAVILVLQVEHVIILPLKNVAPESQDTMEVMTIYATVTNAATLMEGV